MKHRRALVAICAVLAISALCLAVWPSGRARIAAYRDIVLGKPRYFVVTGPPSPEPKDIPVLSQLTAWKVEPVFTGCISSSEHDAYNAVIARHYGFVDANAR